VRNFLRLLLANDVARLKTPGKALYSCMLKPDGGVIDDLIVYFTSDGEYRLVLNAGSRDKDLLWIRRHAQDFEVEVLERRDLGIIAVQGPNAREKAVCLLAPAQRQEALDLKPFFGLSLGSWFVARTGYTGEDGFEIMIPVQDAAHAWQRLAAAGVTPAGLGARDTLRLEAGMNLYGNDMDENHHPLESGLAWTVAFDPADRAFLGREALQHARRSGHAQLVGLVLKERGVLRSHQKILPEGEVTSGTFSPTLNRAIALARIRAPSAVDVRVDIRGKEHAAHIVKPPFVRHGQSLIDHQLKGNAT
jgi:aminomethyltransferase